jgi:GntR family transcriptional repressor for pyruvate dehydrogenase complex
MALGGANWSDQLMEGMCMAPRTRTESALLRVTKQLESQLHELALRDGSRLPSERAMAERFGASRSTVREAVQRLIARGVLQSRPGSGVFMAGAQPSEPASSWLRMITEQPALRADTLEFRAIFECCAARFAADRASAEEKDKLGAVIDDMARAVRQQDVAAEALADAQFHLTLAAISHNFMLTRFYAVVINQLREHITLNTYDANQDARHARARSSARLKQHDAIYQAVRAGQAARAAQAMARHIAYVGAQFKSDQ